MQTKSALPSHRSCSLYLFQRGRWRARAAAARQSTRFSFSRPRLFLFPQKVGLHVRTPGALRIKVIRHEWVVNVSHQTRDVLTSHLLVCAYMSYSLISSACDMQDDGSQRLWCHIGSSLIPPPPFFFCLLCFLEYFLKMSPILKWKPYDI